MTSSKAAMMGPTPADLGCSPPSVSKQAVSLAPDSLAKEPPSIGNQSTSVSAKSATTPQQIDLSKRIKMADKSPLTGVVMAMLLMFPAILAGLVMGGMPWYNVLALVLGLISVPALMVAYYYMPKTSKKGRGARANIMDVTDLPAAYFCYVLGSGGHTTELMELMRKTLRPTKNVHRRYIFTTGDRNSLLAMIECERQIRVVFGENGGTWDAYQITRARNVHQPFWTTWLTSLLSALSALEALTTLPDAEIRPNPEERKLFQYPHVITTNGPGTGLIVALVAHLLKIFWVRNCMKVVFVETWAHVRTLSLTGKLFHWTRIPDIYLVQHAPLAERYKYPLFEFVTLPKPVSKHAPGPAAVNGPGDTSSEGSCPTPPSSSSSDRATCDSPAHKG